MKRRATSKILAPASGRSYHCPLGKRASVSLRGSAPDHLSITKPCSTGALMNHAWMTRSLSFALVGLVAASCDSGTDPDPLKDFDAGTLTLAVESSVAPVEASADANWALTDFISSVLGAGFDPDRPAAIAHLDDARLEKVLGTPTQTALRDLTLATTVEIPAEMLGRTYVYDFAAEGWAVDDTRTGAPSNGVRVIWYGTDAFGDYVLPEQGYIDLTDQDTATMERLGIRVVRTASGTITLADFVYGLSGSDDSTNWSEHLEMVGFFSDGTDQVEVDIRIDAAGSWVTLDETYTIGLFFEGAEGSYRWKLDGSWDDAAMTSTDNLVVTITTNGTPTVLDLDFAASGTIAGTLAYGGVTVANVNMTDSAITLTKAGGGSFTTEQQSQLETLVFTMIFYGPLALSSTPFGGA